jgi:hypothetical protein
MNNDQSLKDRILQSLLDHLDDHGAERFAPKKTMAVEVAAPDKSKLADGLDKAKELLNPKDPSPMEDEDDDMSDEDKLRALLMGTDDDED